MRNPNHDAAGNSLSGQPVLWGARTGDIIRINSIVYFVRDTYPFGVRLELSTEFGADSVGHSYAYLKSHGAIYAEVCQ